MAREQRVRRSREEWWSIVEEWRASGQDAVAFCEARSISVRTFRWWRWRLGESPQGSASAAVREASVNPGEFLEIRARSLGSYESEAIEIEFPSGLRLRCPVGCSGRSLAEVLWALEATGSC